MAKRLIAFLLALVLCVGMLAACGGGNNESTGTEGTEDTKGNETTGSTGAAYVRPNMNGIKITYHVKNNADVDYQDTWLYGQVKNLLGVEIEYIEGADIKLLIADKTPPELRSCNSLSPTDAEYGESGAFINIYDYLDLMPNVKAFLEDPANANNVERFAVREGVLYSLPIAESNGVGGIAEIYSFLYREDIFKANNLTWPTNQEEFVNVLKALKAKYPESYPFVLRSMPKMSSYWGHLWGGSHVMVGWYSSVFTMGEDGKYYMGTTSQAYKEMAQFIKDLMAEGLMHPSTMTITNDEWQNALVNGTCFITYDKADRMPILNPQGQKVNADYKLIVGAPFNFGSYAKTATKVSTSFGNPIVTAYSYMIGNTDNVKNVCKYVDWLYSEEGKLLTTWGVEGVSYEVDAQGNKSFKDGFIENNGGTLVKTGLNNYAMCGNTDFDATLASYEDYIADSLSLAIKYMGGSPAQPTLRYTESEQELFNTHRVNIYNYAVQEWSKFVLGQRDFSEWDKVTEELKKTYHYDDLMKIHEDALARMKK